MEGGFHLQGGVQMEGGVWMEGGVPSERDAAEIAILPGLLYGSSNSILTRNLRLTEDGTEGEVTVLLKELAGGNRQALGELVPMIYEQLRAIAQRQLAGEAQGHTLNATAVVHEAYLRIAQLDRIDWQNRAHFFAIASQAIRRVLVDYAVRRNAAKREGTRKRVELDDVALFDESDADAVLALNQALERLEALEERQVRVVECRFFGGMSIDETAVALDVSKATVKRDWVLARAWLNRELSDA